MTRDRRGRFAATMRCCGAPVFKTRPFQCVHDYERWQRAPEQLDMGLEADRPAVPSAS